MKTNLSASVLLILIISCVRFSSAQDNNVRWSQDPSTVVHVIGNYVDLPQSLAFQNPNKSNKIVNTNTGDYIIAPNFRPFPHTATQSEVDVVTQTGNANVMFASWNSFGPAFYGTGYAATTNEGVSWTGNFQTFPSNSGDPGPFIWPTGSTWPGRFGLSAIQGAAYSTNQGAAWTGFVSFAGASSFDKNLSAVDDITGSSYFGRAYTVWTNFSGTYVNRIVISYTTDGGTSWTTAAPVSPVPSSGHHHQGCDVQVGPGGVVHVIWANCTTNGQNSTEDSLGYARSTDGGVTWTFASNHVEDMNGIRAASFFNSIRANGFPRIAIDKSGGTRNGWIYVVAGEKNFTPALDNADVVLSRSTDNGATWTRVRVNQDVSGGLNYFPAVNVDAYGGVNVIYYDQRNVSSTQAQVYMSRSLDGGVTWTDVQVSDHSFTPAPIAGLAGGYQGDYIGVTSGNDKVWPFWMDNFSGIYQVWTTSVDVKPDLWSQDTPADVGIEPNPDTGPMWISQDIWVRNQQDGFTNLHQHQNPEYRDSVLYPYNPDYVYVMVRNRGGRAASGQLKVYWAKASTGLSWPTQWVNYHVGLALYGDLIHSSSPIINNLAPNDSVVFEIPWFPPNPSDFSSFGADSSHFCLLARIETSPVSPYGMTFPEGTSIGANVNNNNNIVWKNLTVVDNFTGPNGPQAAGWVTIRNIRRDVVITRIRFQIPRNEYRNPFTKYGKIEITLTDKLLSKWMEGGRRGNGIEYIGENKILIAKEDTYIDNIKLDPDEMETIKSNFILNDQPPEGLDQFNFGITQSEMKDTEELLIGGENFALNTHKKGKGEQENSPVKEFGISAYPNPFNPVSNINYSLPKGAYVTIRVYDVLGQEITTLVNEYKQSGKYIVRFDGTNLASGVYFYRIDAGEFTQTSKLLLIR